jgi:SpoVK/Ycf46/Vps4 family AAA+-type ATPase
MYPSLLQKGISLTDYYEAFANSDAKILLLMGQRGTGKTSFLRGLLHHNKWNPIISYDEALLSNDQMLIKFLLSESNCFIIEDADTFIYKREQGNNVIHKFLNLGDGLITKSDKKLILTTNITSTDEIDSALIRPGRCFDVLHFDTLTPEQAKTLIDTTGMNVPLPDRDVTIAELFNQQPIFSGNTLKKRVGFLR